MRWLYIFRKTLKNVAFTGSYLDLIDVPPSPASAPIITASDGLEATPTIDGLDIQMLDVGNVGSYGIVTTNSKGQVVSGKRQFQMSGVTGANGVSSLPYGFVFSQPPNVIGSIIGGEHNQTLIFTVTTGGISASVRSRNAVMILGVEVLLAGTSPVQGANVNFLITEK